MNDGNVIAIIANDDVWTYNLRKELIEKLIDEGFKVVLVMGYGPKIDYFTNLNCKFVDLKINRHGLNPFAELKLILRYKTFIKKIRPNIILTYTIKPNIYGNIAANKYKIPVISTITGLGEAVENNGILQKVLIVLMHVMRNAKSIVFQNETNLQFCDKHKITHDNALLVNGSGVNLDNFTFKKNSNKSTEVKFLFVGRILKDKGIEELKESYLELYKKNKNISLTLIGDYTPGYEAFFNGLEGYNIFYKGYQSDVRPFLKDCDAIVLPSYHEGMANVLLEAAATGRAIIASDIAGCRETFDDGKSGIAFESKNIESLQYAMEKFAGLTKEEQVNMGMLGRKKVEEQFNRVDVVNAYMAEIEKHIK